MILRHRSFC